MELLKAAKLPVLDLNIFLLEFFFTFLLIVDRALVLFRQSVRVAVYIAALALNAEQAYLFIA